MHFSNSIDVKKSKERELATAMPNNIDSNEESFSGVLCECLIKRNCHEQKLCRLPIMRDFADVNFCDQHILKIFSDISTCGHFRRYFP